MKIHRIVKSLRVARFNKNFNLVSRMRMYIKPEIQYVLPISTSISSISRVSERRSFVPREDNFFRYKNKYPLEFANN